MTTKPKPKSKTKTKPKKTYEDMYAVYRLCECSIADSGPCSCVYRDWSPKKPTFYKAYSFEEALDLWVMNFPEVPAIGPDVFVVVTASDGRKRKYKLEVTIEEVKK